MTANFADKPWFQYPKFQWKHKHAIIIGGGISGCQMAWHLCQSGWQITLIERHEKLATEASGNVAGVISPKMTSEESHGEDFYSECFSYTLSLLKTLKKQGKKIIWNNCGAIQLAHNKREEKRWNALNNRNLPSNFIQLLDKHETSQQAGIELPYKSSYFPQAGWVDPASFCNALSDHPNCNIIYQNEALNLRKDNENWHVLNTMKNKIAQAEAIIICSGKDLKSFDQSRFLPSMPVAGQTTSALAGENNTLKTVIGHEGYLTPAINKQHIFGATFEREEDNPSLQTDADNKNREQLKQYLPEFTASLSNFESSHAAVRMTTPDRYPYFGVLPDENFYQNNYSDLHQGKKYKAYPYAEYQTGLFVLGGLGSRGLTTSGLCAKLLSHIMDNTALTKRDKLLLDSCHPARFLVKNLKKNSGLF